MLPLQNAFCNAKMHLHQMHAKMHFCITFYEVKCSAEHFPKENVESGKMLCFFALQKTKAVCKNAFLHQMHLMQKCDAALQKCMHFAAF